MTLGGPGWYFQSPEEANEWLEFDTDGEEMERRAYAENDRFEEWRKWRNADIVAGVSPNEYDQPQ